MQIIKFKENITITHGDDQVTFEGVPAIRKPPGVRLIDKSGKETTRDELLFAELNRYWLTLRDKDVDEIFAAYKLLAELKGEDPEVLREHVPGVIKVLAKHHTLKQYMELYPIDSVFIPQKLHYSFNDMSPNYTESMTYIVSDYYKLMMHTMILKPFIPVINILGAFIGGKGLSQELKRKVVYNINLAFDMLSETEIMKSEAIDKLGMFLASLVEKFQKELSNRPNNTSLGVLASVCGYGSDMMDEYLLALTVVKLLAMRPVYGDYKDGRMEDSSIVSSIYFGIKTEVESGFANRIAGSSIVMKQHPTSVVFNGEKGKVSAIDLVQGRSNAPIKESVRGAMTMMKYRQFIKNTGLDIPPANVKILIDSMAEKHTGPTYELHEWLTAAAIHRYVDRRSFKDIDPDKFVYGMALAQAIYLYYGMKELAQLLSCEMLPNNISGYPIDPIDNELKISVDRYYPQAYQSNRNQEQQRPLRGSLDLLVRNHVTPYYFHLKATDEAAAMLGCDTDIPQYRPGGRILTQLTEFLGIQARHKLNEVKWFNQ